MGLLLVINVVATQYDVHFRLPRIKKKLEKEAVELAQRQSANGTQVLSAHFSLYHVDIQFLYPYIHNHTNIVYHPMGYAEILHRFEIHIDRGDSRG